MLTKKCIFNNLFLRTVPFPFSLFLFLAQHVLRSGKSWRFSPTAVQHLSRHEWTGNVRELANAIERATVLARDSEIEPEDLLLEQAGLEGPVSTRLGEEPLQETLDRAAAERIRLALDKAAGRKADAALVLGVDRTTLYRLMKRLDIT